MKANKERIAEINKHSWNWTKKSDCACSELTGHSFTCEYCGKEIEYHFEMINENNEKIYVGSECMKRIGWIETELSKKEIKFKLEIMKKEYQKAKEQSKYEKETGIKIGSKIISTDIYKLRIETPAPTFSGKKPEPYVTVKGFKTDEYISGGTKKQGIVIQTSGTNLILENVQKWLNENMIIIEG